MSVLQVNKATKEVKQLLSLYYNNQQKGLATKCEGHLVKLDLINLGNMLLSEYLWFQASHYLHTSHICRLWVFRLSTIQEHKIKRKRRSVVSLLGGGNICQLTGSLKATQNEEHNPIHRRAQLKQQIRA